MPSLPIPLETTLGGGDLPVTSSEDVLAEFSSPQRDTVTAPVRDAFAEAYAESFIVYQNAAERLAALCDPIRSVGEFLREMAEDREVPVTPGDTDDQLRTRLFEIPKIVTPTNIETAINTILGKRTTKTCHISELNLDGYFVNSGGSSVWQSFVGVGIEPDYSDRYYDDLPVQLPGGALLSSGIPRSFLVRLPVLAGANNIFTYVSSDPTVFAGDGSDTSGSESSGDIGYFTYKESQTADDLYATIVAVINAKKGQGMTWSLLVDDTI